MKLTGQCEIDFEKWYLEMILNERLDYNKFTNTVILRKFYREIQSMQYGVLVDFFDSVQYKGVGIFTHLFPLYYKGKNEYFSHNYIIRNTLEGCISIYNKILKDNEIYNESNQ